jgi:hypothetical protein
MVDSFHPHDQLPEQDVAGANPRRFALVRREVDDAEEASLVGEEASFAALSTRIADLELQLREQVAIERMRDLELGRLEHELDEKSHRLQAVEDALFHERRRSAELERRWNVLADSYEQTAARLVETGATLAAIHSQRSYRALVTFLRAIGWNRRADSLAARHGGVAIDGEDRTLEAPSVSRRSRRRR